MWFSSVWPFYLGKMKPEIHYLGVYSGKISLGKTMFPRAKVRSVTTADYQCCREYIKRSWFVTILRFLTKFCSKNIFKKYKSTKAPLTLGVFFTKVLPLSIFCLPHDDLVLKKFLWLFYQIPVAEGDRGYGGFATLDVESVNLIKYPKFKEVKWQYAALIPGNCLFLPYSEYASVTSTISFYCQDLISQKKKTKQNKKACYSHHQINKALRLFFLIKVPTYSSPDHHNILSESGEWRKLAQFRPEWKPTVDLCDTDSVPYQLTDYWPTGSWSFCECSILWHNVRYKGILGNKEDGHWRFTSGAYYGWLWFCFWP